MNKKNISKLSGMWKSFRLENCNHLNQKSTCDLDDHIRQERNDWAFKAMEYVFSKMDESND